MEHIRQLLRHRMFDPVRYGAGVSMDHVRIAESELGVKFPETYILFLTSLGWIKSPYISILGLGPGTKEEGLDLVFTTKWEQTESGLPLPPYLVPINNDGAGNLSCLDTSRMQQGECPIVYWDHESEDGLDQIPNTVGRNFDVWLLEEIAGILQQGPGEA